MVCNLKSYFTKALDLRFNCFVWLGATGKSGEKIIFLGNCILCVQCG